MLAAQHDTPKEVYFLFLQVSCKLMLYLMHKGQ